MIDLLKKLRDESGVIEIKAEFENEGSRLDELLRLKDVADKVDLPLIIKIGGVEAVTDIYNCIILGAKCIIAPMAETAFAVNKFISAIKNFVAADTIKDTEFYINIETITAFKNLDEILSLKEISILDGVTVGRVDFTSSLDKTRDFVNSPQMLSYCETIFSKCRDKNLRCALGGAISSESENFILNLTKKKLIDKFETRKIVYHKDAVKNIELNILEGIKFELLWLEAKENYYHRIKIEDQRRILMLRKRLNQV